MTREDLSNAFLRKLDEEFGEEYLDITTPLGNAKVAFADEVKVTSSLVYANDKLITYYVSWVCSSGFSKEEWIDAIIDAALDKFISVSSSFSGVLPAYFCIQVQDCDFSVIKEQKFSVY